MVILGQAIFFDKELSGSRDLSCATCHHPTLGTGGGAAVSVGVGGVGLGPERTLGLERVFISRNATDLFNQGTPALETIFWDSRIGVWRRATQLCSPPAKPNRKSLN